MSIGGVGAVIFQDGMSSSKTFQQTKQPRFEADILIDWWMYYFGLVYYLLELTILSGKYSLITEDSKGPSTAILHAAPSTFLLQNPRSTHYQCVLLLLSHLVL